MVKERDANTAFFHVSASMLNKSNKMHALRMEDGVIQGPRIHDYVFQQFKKLFGERNQFRNK